MSGDRPRPPIDDSTRSGHSDQDIDVSLPNVLYLGLARAGSTWLSEVLQSHPDIYVPPIKDIYFFDREYTRGPGWYRQFFADGSEAKVRMEFSHDYLHVPFVPGRVKESIAGDLKFVITLREPVSWILSTYQNMRRNGVGSEDLGWVMSKQVSLVAGGLYSSYLRHWLNYFDREQFLIYLFDDLRADPAVFLRTVVRDLGLEPMATSSAQVAIVNEAAEARWAGAARLTRAGANVVRRLGHPEIVGRLKRSGLVRSSLYRRVDRSAYVSDEVQSALQQFYRDDVHELSDVTGLDLVARWGY